MIKCMYKKSPHIFVKVAIEVGIPVAQKMTDVEAAAMWVEANISFRAARIILRHLHAKFNFRLQVPLNRLALLSDIAPTITPTFGEFQYKKKGEETKVAETVKYWTICPTEIIQTDFS